MSNRIPPGAFPEAAEHLTRAVKRPDGGDVKAFGTQATALSALRVAVNEHEDELFYHEGQLSLIRSDLVSLESRIAALEEQPSAFPFAGSGSPGG